MTSIILENLTKRFGTLTAVDQASFEVSSEEVLCLLGPSGCGKTTTLRMIAGLETVTDGRISLTGSDVTALPARDRNVAMAFQFYALYPNLTVGENLAYPLYSEGLQASDILKKVSEIAQILMLDTVLDRYPHQLSEGEKQRVAVGRCIIRRPNCFLFDEPLSRLDVQLREEMRGDIKSVLSNLSRPTVIVTHDQLEAMTMGDRIAVMRAGKVEQIGAPQDVFRKPDNVFVAGFIGTPQMNLLEGATELVDGKVKIRLAHDLLELPKIQNEFLGGETITFGARPRSAILHSEGGPNILSGTCELVEPMGAETLLRIQHPSGQIRAVTENRSSIREGGSIHVSFPLNHICLFEKSGLRMEELK